MQKQGYGFDKSFFTEGVNDFVVPVRLKGLGTIAASTKFFLISTAIKTVNDLLNK